MTASLSRLVPGQTRFGVFQNLDCQIDRECLGVWYLSIHFAPFYLQFTGNAETLPTLEDCFAALALVVFCGLLFLL